MQLYLKKPIPKKLQNCVSRFRLSSHSLSIETGRYHNIVQTNKLCPVHVTLILKMNSILFLYVQCTTI